jgi:predicted transcriptional regulator
MDSDYRSLEKRVSALEIRRSNRKRKPSVYLEGFVFISSFTNKYLYENPNITKIDYRVFHYICSSINPHDQQENAKKYSMTEIATELGISRSQISKAFKSLLEKGLILPEIDAPKTYYINPEAVYKGKAQNYGTEFYKKISDSPNGKITEYQRSFFECDFIKKKILYLQSKGLKKGYLLKYHEYYQQIKSKFSNIE